jgi:hypothetical protein
MDARQSTPKERAHLILSDERCLPNAELAEQCCDLFDWLEECSVDLFRGALLSAIRTEAVRGQQRFRPSYAVALIALRLLEELDSRGEKLVDVAEDLQAEQAIRSLQIRDKNALAGKNRWRRKSRGTPGPITDLIKRLARKTDSLGEPLRSSELWPELFSELEAAGRDPEELEDGKVIEYDGGRITRDSFKTILSRTRRT